MLPVQAPLRNQTFDPDDLTAEGTLSPTSRNHVIQPAARQNYDGLRPTVGQFLHNMPTDMQTRLVHTLCTALAIPSNQCMSQLIDHIDLVITSPPNPTQNQRCYKQ